MTDLIIPRWGRPREQVKRFPVGSYAVQVETTYYINNRWVEKRKRPLYHVVEVAGFIDMDGVFGCSGLHVYKLGTHYKKEKALKSAKRLNDEQRRLALEAAEEIEVEPNGELTLEQFFTRACGEA